MKWATISVNRMVWSMNQGIFLSETSPISLYSLHEVVLQRQDWLINICQIIFQIILCKICNLAWLYDVVHAVSAWSQGEILSNWNIWLKKSWGKIPFFMEDFYILHILDTCCEEVNLKLALFMPKMWILFSFLISTLQKKGFLP